MRNGFYFVVFEGWEPGIYKSEGEFYQSIIGYPSVYYIICESYKEALIFFLDYYGDFEITNSHLFLDKLKDNYYD